MGLVRMVMDRDPGQTLHALLKGTLTMPTKGMESDMVFLACLGPFLK